MFPDYVFLTTMVESFSIEKNRINITEKKHLGNIEMSLILRVALILAVICWVTCLGKKTIAGMTNTWHTEQESLKLMKQAF